LSIRRLEVKRGDDLTGGEGFPAMAHWWSTAAAWKVFLEALEGWTGCRSTR
jgi:hypothetical protein